MNDTLSIALTALGYCLGAGVIGLGLGYLLRRGSLRLATAGIAVIAVGVLVAGLVGTSRAMFISAHDLRVATEVTVVAGLVALVFALLVGDNLARRARAVQREAARMGETGRFTAPVEGLPTELAALADELERASRGLADAREREHRLETSRRELLAWVSHDLRTPLAGIRAMAESLEDGIATDPDRYHRRIVSEVERLSRMVDDLFELSRLEAGIFELSPEQVPVRDLVSEAVAGADPIARARGVRLDGCVDGDPQVSVDPAAMRRVLLNLLTNAVRHTPDDGSVQISARGVPDGIEVDVADACGGIPDDDLPRLFDLAWRGTPARTPAAGDSGDSGDSGAGLGLAIVKGIVEAHAGRVTVRNESGGCRFTVLLPAT